jgi:hypothetical protein
VNSIIPRHTPSDIFLMEFTQQPPA